MTDRDSIIPEHLRTSTICAIFDGMAASGDWSRMPVFVDAMRDADASEDDLRNVAMGCVRAGRDHDAPRLVFADLIEEREPERAAFIRSPNQACQSDSSVGQFCPSFARRRPVQRRPSSPPMMMVVDAVEQFCSTCEALKSFGVPREMLGENRYTVRRGFIDSVRCNASEWLVYERMFLREQPLQRVHLTTWPNVITAHIANNNTMRFQLEGNEAFLVLTEAFLTMNRLSGDALQQYVTEKLLAIAWPKLTFELPEDFNGFMQGFRDEIVRGIRDRYLAMARPPLRDTGVLFNSIPSISGRGR